MTLHGIGYPVWHPPRRSRWTLVLLAVFWFVVATVYVAAAVQQKNRINISAAAGGQYPYLIYAQGMATEGVTRYFGDRNRMPVVPALLTLVYHSNWDTFFGRACWLAIGSSVVVLTGIGLLAYRSLPVWPATALTLSAVVCVFIQKASFVGAELPYYGLLFASWLLLCRLIRRPDGRWAAAGGALLGLTYLTKASALATGVTFLGAMIVYAVVLALRPRNSEVAPCAGMERPDPKQIVIHAAIATFFFLMIIWPYIASNHDRFGRYFYNVNSRFFMWCDSWSQAKSFADKYDIGARYPDGPPAEIPGPANYWRTHTARQLMGRLDYGFRALGTLAIEGRYFKYIAAAAFFCLVFGYRQRHRLYAISTEHRVVVLFGSLFFGGQILCYAWYAQVAYGDRFILSLFLPALFALLQWSHRLGVAMTGVPILGRRVCKSDLLAIAMTAFLLGDGAVIASSSLYRPGEAFVQFYFNESHELLEAGRLQEAAKGFRGVIQLDPSFAPAHRDLGMAALLSGRFDEAIDSLGEAARLQPLDADIRNSLGSALLQTGRIAEAIREFAQATHLNPTLAVAWFNLGVSYHQHNDDREATRVLQRLSLLDVELGRALAELLRE